jgi:hypothetical protein
VLEPIVGVECRRRFSPLGRGEYSYDIELYAFIKMFASTNVLSFEASSTSLSCNVLNKCGDLAYSPTRSNPTTPWIRREGDTTPRKLNNSLLFSRSIYLSLFVFGRTEGGREMMGDH